MLFVLLPCPAGLASEVFQAGEQGFRITRGDQYIQFDKGNWTAGIEGAGRFRWHMFLWHDQWIYETLPRGTIESGPTLQGDGSLVMTGTFSTREAAPPVQYRYRITPTDNGVQVRCRLKKSGPLKLTSGIWLHVGADRRDLTGNERVWMCPSWHGTVGSSTNGTAERFLVELQGKRSLCFTTPDLRAVASEESKGRYLYRFNVLSGDFADAAEIEYTVAFTEMPDRFPRRHRAPARATRDRCRPAGLRSSPPIRPIGTQR